MLFCHFQLVRIITHCLICNIFQGNLRSARNKYPLSVKFSFLFRHSQNLCSVPADLFPQFFRRLNHCHTGNIGCTGCIRSTVIRRYIRINSRYNDIFDITVQAVSRHLGKNGITSGPHIGTAYHKAVESIIIDL